MLSWPINLFRYGGFGCVGSGGGRLPLASNNWETTPGGHMGDLAILKDKIWWRTYLEVSKMYPNLHSSQCTADVALLRNVSGLGFACGGISADQVELEDCEDDIMLLKKYMFEGFSTTTIHVDTMSPVADAPTTAPTTASLGTRVKKKNNSMMVIAIGLGAAVVTLIIGYISMLFFTKKERKREREKEQMFKMVRWGGLFSTMLACNDTPHGLVCLRL